jgi:GTP-binding protein HflX
VFERHQGGDVALLVHVNFSGQDESDLISEFQELVASTDAEIVSLITASRRSPESKYYVGTGKAEEIRQQVKALNAEVVIFNHDLSPAQERNLEQLFECRVLDRTGLILDIFASRARSHEGKLQVELAQLRHLSTRLVRGWTHLERQKGGIGLRGPGETQLETDRRLLNERIKYLNKRLAKVRKQREQGRRSRQRAEIPTLSLVGYTNAGKSTLFNQMASSDVYAADQLFATLDPTLRRVEVADGMPVILADTVGFIRDLPHDLVAAFRSTLQETQEARLLLHVIDASDPERDEKIHQVAAVLKEIGADEVPQLQVFNKIDCMNDVAPRIERNEAGQPLRVWLSARENQGMELLREAIAELLVAEQFHGWLQLPMAESRLRARLFELGAVLGEQYSPEGDALLEVRLDSSKMAQLQKHYEIERYILPDKETELAVTGQAP